MISGHAPRGTGNAVSAEFNSASLLSCCEADVRTPSLTRLTAVLYRWHAAISKKDEQWLEGIFRKYLGDVPFDEVTDAQFMSVLGKLQQEQKGAARTWKIPGIERTGADGSFNDEDLCRILTEATDEVAGAFGANGSPVAMRIIDILGMATARSDWNVCTMNGERVALSNASSTLTFPTTRIPQVPQPQAVRQF